MIEVSVDHNLSRLAATKGFLAFLRGEEAKAIFKRAGFLPSR